MGENEQVTQVEEVLREAQVQPIGAEQVRTAMQTLLQYKSGKAQLENRVIANNEWWKLRQWGQFDEKGNPRHPGIPGGKPTPARADGRAGGADAQSDRAVHFGAQRF